MPLTAADYRPRDAEHIVLTFAPTRLRVELATSLQALSLDARGTSTS